MSLSVPSIEGTAIITGRGSSLSWLGSYLSRHWRQQVYKECSLGVCQGQQNNRQLHCLLRTTHTVEWKQAASLHCFRSTAGFNRSIKSNSIRAASEKFTQIAGQDLQHCVRDIDGHALTTSYVMVFLGKTIVHQWDLILVLDSWDRSCFKSCLKLERLLVSVQTWHHWCDCVQFDQSTTSLCWIRVRAHVGCSQVFFN